MSDDSADSGVNIKLDNSPSDNENESTENQLYGKRQGLQLGLLVKTLLLVTNRNYFLLFRWRHETGICNISKFQ